MFVREKNNKKTITSLLKFVSMINFLLNISISNGYQYTQFQKHDRNHF